MKDANRNSQTALTRRDLLKLAGGALGVGALSYTAGLLNQSPATLPGPGALPEYVDGGLGLPVFRGPYLQQQAHMAAFLFPADPVKLGALCDRCLNISTESPFKYVPLLSNLVMIYTDMLVASLDERDRQVGFIPETELSFWVPVLALRKTAAGYVPDHLVWFLPCLFVDEGNAIATGREVYGFNKQQAQFQKPDSIQAPHFVASVMGFQSFGPTERAETQPLLELRRSQPAAVSAPAEIWQDWPAAQSALTSQIPGNVQGASDVPWLDFATHLVMDNAPLIFLKQFRDAADTRLACFQALVEAPVKLQNFYAGGFLSGHYELNINPLASHPLSAWLGIDSQPATLGVWMTVDFNLETGREIWRNTP